MDRRGKRRDERVAVGIESSILGSIVKSCTIRPRRAEDSMKEEPQEQDDAGKGNGLHETKNNSRRMARST